jgi:hypothetical protein
MDTSTFLEMDHFPVSFLTCIKKGEEKIRNARIATRIITTLFDQYLLSPRGLKKNIQPLKMKRKPIASGLVRKAMEVKRPRSST